jgi:hypothetical protein
LEPAFTLVSSLAHSSNLKMQAACRSETSIGFQWTIRCYIREDRSLNTQNISQECRKYLTLKRENIREQFRIVHKEKFG